MSDWVHIFTANPGAPLRLVCFPHAGGAAQFFRAWGTQLPAVEVLAIQPPGRWSRRGERPFRRLDALATAAADALVRELDRPYALFGHSLGALVAFEVARLYRGRGLQLPRRLVVSSRAGPQIPLARAPLHELAGERLVAEVRDRYGGIPEQVLADPDLLELMLPVLQADMEVYETYVHHDEPPLPVPVTAIAGDEDPLVDRDGLRAWGEQTSAGCTVHRLPGGHFYLGEGARAFFELLRGELERRDPVR